MNDSTRPLARSSNETPVNLPANRQEAEYYSDAVVEFLSRLGVEYVFLLPGSSYRGLHDSLVNFGRNHKPQIVMATHEQIAVAMAHGYSKATGKLGVCMLHDLVGVMNGSMGIYNAYGDHAPVMVIGGSGPLDPADRRWIDWLHTANQQSEIVKRYVKWADDPVTGQATLDALARGYKAAMTQPTGPVYITVDCALQERRIEGPLKAPDQRVWQIAPPVAANPQALAKAADMLLAAEFPLIVGGRFSINPAATAPIVDLVETTGAGYRDDLALIGFPTAHKQNLSGDRNVIKEADLVLAVDCRDLSSLLDAYTEQKKLVGSGRDRTGLQVIDLSLNDLAWTSWSYLEGSQAPVDLQLSCDPLAGMTQLAEAVRAKLKTDAAARARIEARKAKLAERHDKLRAQQRDNARKDWDSSPITPGRMISELWEAVKDKDWLLAVRNQASFPEGIWQFTGAGQYLGHNGGGGVGYGPGAAVGAAIACRDAGKFCVAIFGDGDYVMSSGAIWTAVHNRTPMLALINDNRTWGNDEKHQIEVAHDRGRPVENAWIGQRMVDPDINHAMNARSYGAWAAGPVSDPNELASVLKQAVAEVEKGHVAVVEVRTRLV